MIFQRRTLAGEQVFEGVGLHSGQPVVAKVVPGDRGIWFNCNDSSAQAKPENVTDTRRCTRLGEVSTVEHLMSAFAALEVTDAEVELSGTEMPALDGASLAFLKGLRCVGTADIGSVELTGPFARVFDREGETFVAAAKGEGHWRYLFDTGQRWPGIQDFELFLNIASYESQIAPARTFAFEEEVEEIRAAGMGLGLDESTALVLGAEGYVNDSRFQDEPVRHKMLDLIGDLYLSGVPIRMLDVVAERSGHAANVRTAQKLAEAVRFSSVD